MTATVYSFPKKAKAARKSRSDKPGWYREDGKKKWRMYTLTHLEGKRPLCHPNKIPKTPKGKVILEVGQVWVCMGPGTLEVIERLTRRKDGLYTVTLKAYRAPPSIYQHIIAERTLRSCYRVYDAYIKELAITLETLKASIEAGEGRPFGITTFAQASQFFGINPETGVRID